MNFIDDAAAANHRLWEEEVRKECGYTTPWLDLDVATLRRYVEKGPGSTFSRLDTLCPTALLREVAGKDVLCLASGGGQQSAVFALLGANVTVVDLSEGQLRGDQIAADHYGYSVTLIQADMRDLSCLGTGSFDLVYQSESLAYVPDVHAVYTEVARVLRPHGHYRVSHAQPAVFAVEWQDGRYSITEPYAESVKRRPDGGIEFRHCLSEILNGLLSAGFVIESLHEAPYYRQTAPQVTPGSWLHQQRYVAGDFAIVARKRSDNR